VIRQTKKRAKTWAAEDGTPTKGIEIRAGMHRDTAPTKAEEEIIARQPFIFLSFFKIGIAKFPKTVYNGKRKKWNLMPT